MGIKTSTKDVYLMCWLGSKSLGRCPRSVLWAWWTSRSGVHGCTGAPEGTTTSAVLQIRELFLVLYMSVVGCQANQVVNQGKNNHEGGPGSHIEHDDVVVDRLAEGRALSQLADLLVLFSRGAGEQEPKLVVVYALVLWEVEWITLEPHHRVDETDDGKPQHDDEPYEQQDVCERHKDCTGDSAANPAPPALVHLGSGLPSRQAAYDEDHEPQAAHAGPHHQHRELHWVEPVEVEAEDVPHDAK